MKQEDLWTEVSHLLAQADSPEDVIQVGANIIFGIMENAEVSGMELKSKDFNMRIIIENMEEKTDEAVLTVH